LKDLVTFLKELRDDVLIFPSNDLLAHIDSKKTCAYSSEGIYDGVVLGSIVRSARVIEKKTGINPTCISEGIIQIESNAKISLSPIFLTPIEVKNDKTYKTFKISKLEDKKILNPYLINLFEISNQMEDEIKDFESFIKILNIDDSDCEKDVSYIGNFHPKRFSFIREIEDLIDQKTDFSNALNNLFGGESKHQVRVSKTPLFRNDEDQLQALEKLSQGSLVVQGPPGTGKSQLIGNIIGNIIELGQTILLTSEKKVALDVIQNKLHQKELGILSFQIPSKHPNRLFIGELKNVWDYFNQLKEIPSKQSFKNFKIQKKIFDVLHQESLKQGCSSHELIQLLENNRNLSLKINEGGNITLSAINHSNQEILRQIPGPLLKISSRIKPTLLEEDFLNFSKELNYVIEVLEKLRSEKKVESWENLQITLYQLLQFYAFEQNSYKKFGRFIDRNKDDFIQLERDYYNSKRKLDTLEGGLKNWLKEPSIEELEFLKGLLQKQHLFRYKLKWYFTWRKWSRTPKANPEMQIKNRIKYEKKKRQHETIVNKLFVLGIQNPENDLPQIRSLIDNTNLENWNNFKEEGIKKKITISHKKLYQTIDFLKHSFKFQSDDIPINILNDIYSQKEEFLEAWPKLKELPSEIYPFLQEDLNQIKSNIEAAVCNQIKINNPELKKFSITRFLEECRNVNNAFDEESSHYANQLVRQQFEVFSSYEELTKIPPKRLSPEDKEFRMQLKKGKSLLVKEFGKKRAHKPIRILFNTEAVHWIKVLKPIWMSNPNSLSESLPLKKEIFDFVIADEASQLLLSHSVGALQRGKQTIICGDPQQMSPSSFFRKKQRLEIDLLHHANYYLKSVFLSNHYRSLHPQLIAFSNSFFYNNRLKAFQDTHTNGSPIEHHYIKGGKFMERKNQEEAKKIASFISKHIRNDEKLGIVAFSQSQLECIYENLNDDVKEILNRRSENDSLFFQSLEKVQGDECDRLVISFGYGFNGDDKFEMRFGPVNLDQGHKRLNVLFSRAKRKIDFFSSVRYSDFPKSENTGVDHVKKWFQLLDKKQTHEEVNSTIPLSHILNDCNGFNDLISYLHVYSERGYKVQN